MSGDFHSGSSMSLPIAPLVIRLLGVPEIRLNGRTRIPHRRLVRALLYYIAAHSDGVSRDKIAGLLAPNESQGAARRL